MTLTSRTKGSSMVEAHVFDVQGTLIDVTSVRTLVECDKPDFDAFHEATGNCPANQDIVDASKRSHTAQKVVVVMTGMNEKFRGLVATWLYKHEVPFDLLLMRPNGDYRKDFVVKREMLKDVRLRGFVVTHAWDDNPQIIDLWKNEKIPVTVVPGWTGKR
jgi:hypothetical protein